jgi:cysteinyl-tRNA synthetase
MPIAFYNTLSRRVEEFHPLLPGRVSMYACGPTVYNYFHVGNARSFVMADVIRRYFAYRGYDVAFVMNITDVDDRIIAQAIEEGVTADDVARRYTDAFFEDLEALGVRPATVHPRATGHMSDIVAHIGRLVEAGAAYVLEGDVYYRVSAFPTYGKLSGKRVDELLAGARVEADTRKKHPADFALWKAAKPGEPAWDSPWGPGRPGWHIECSVMSMKHLGESFDIHAGGNDLVFPHHENEIAQSEVLTHRPLARYWIHFGFLNVDNEKMSKSLGNFFTARDVLAKYPAPALRFFYLQNHYRSPINFSDESLEAADRGRQRLQAFRDALAAHPAGNAGFDVSAYEARFVENVDQDFNFPSGLAAIFDLVRDLGAAMRDDAAPDAESKNRILDFLDRTAGGVFGILSASADLRERDLVLAKRLDNVLGDLKESFYLNQDLYRRANSELLEGDPSKVIAAIVECFIDARREARRRKDWKESDRIRDVLLEAGIRLEDGKDGTTWKRV